MISKIYDSNKILFKSGKRKGHSKETIMGEVESKKVVTTIRPKKVKKKKIKTFNQDMLEMYEKRREKRRNESKR